MADGGRMTAGAVQWNGTDDDLAKARELLAPALNVIRAPDRLRGDCLQLTNGAAALTVPRGFWIVKSTVDGQRGVTIMSDPEFCAAYVAPKPHVAEVAPWL